MSVIDAIIAKKLCGGGGGSIPKPLTYDYMPEGYPKKTAAAVTVMEEQEVLFTDDKGNPPYFGYPAEPFEIVVGQTYIVNWDGTDYERICVDFSTIPCLGNLSIADAGDDTGEPFIYTGGRFLTLDASASHTISVKTAEEIVTPMAEEFLPNIPADKLPAGGVTTLHINVTAVNFETMEATFTADKTPSEMQQAAVNGPVWCVVTVAAGIMAEKAVSVGVPPAWYGVGVVAFGSVTAFAHDNNGDNETGYAVRAGSEGWLLDLTQLGN